MDDGDRGRKAADTYMRAALADHRSKGNQGTSRVYCIDCEEPIPDKRRQAVPGCERCVFCQQKAEVN